MTALPPTYYSTSGGRGVGGDICAGPGEPSTLRLGIIGVLLAIVVWFLKRIITDNDKAHQELGTRIERMDGKIDRVDGKVDRLASDVADVRESVGRIEGHLLHRPAR